MRLALSLALLIAFAGATAARPVTIEPTSGFTTPDATYAGFAMDVEIDGNYAIATARDRRPRPTTTTFSPINHRPSGNSS